MRYIFYYTVFALIATQSMICMDTPGQQQLFFTFLSDEELPKRFPVALEIAQQCGSLKLMFEDLQDIPLSPAMQLEEKIENAKGKDVERFVDYLTNIHTLNQPKISKTDQKVIKRKFSEITRHLTTSQLINFFGLIDRHLVIDKKNNHYIAKEITTRITDKPDLLKQFTPLSGRPLFGEVIKQMSKKINFEEKLIQPYVDAITQERSQLKRTIPLATLLYYNISNALTAPFRFFRPWPWAAKTIMQPCYVNTQTGTIITSVADQLDKTNKITQLIITKKDCDNIIIPITADIKEIVEIEANATESIFICRQQRKTFVIDLTNKEKPIVISDNIINGVFSDINNQLYVINTQGKIETLNTLTNSSTLLYETGNDNFYCIAIKKQGPIIAVLAVDESNRQKTERTLLLAKKDTQNNLQFLDIRNSKISNKFDTNKYRFRDKIIKAPITTMCLHPDKNKIYVERKIHNFNPTTKCDQYVLFCIDFTDMQNLIQTIVLATYTTEKSHCLQFLPENNDILFLGKSSTDDYFINIQTNNFWRQKKNKGNGIRTLAGYENHENYYKRLALTADGKQSIEQAVENNLLIDLITTTAKSNSSSDKPLDLSTIRTTSTSLIDDATLQTINNINNGYIPASVIDIALNKPTTIDATTMHNMHLGLQKIISTPRKSWGSGWTKNIFYLFATCSAVLMKFKKSINLKAFNLGIIDTEKIFGFASVAALFTFLIDRAVSQY